MQTTEDGYTALHLSVFNNQGASMSEMLSFLKGSSSKKYALPFVFQRDVINRDER